VEVPSRILLEKYDTRPKKRIAVSGAYIGCLTCLYLGAYDMLVRCCSLVEVTETGTKSVETVEIETF
jgi:hypothetical protein